MTQSKLDEILDKLHFEDSYVDDSRDEAKAAIIELFKSITPKEHNFCDCRQEILDRISNL